MEAGEVKQAGNVTTDEFIDQTIPSCEESGAFVVMHPAPRTMRGRKVYKFDLHEEVKKRCGQFPLYSQEDVKDPTVCAKLFFLAGPITWYVTEYDPDTRMAFGYATGFVADEWGYFSISEMQAVKYAGAPAIEVDLHFEAKPASALGLRR